MRPAARVVRSEQMSRLSWIIAEGGSTFLIFYFKSLLLCLFYNYQENMWIWWKHLFVGLTLHSYEQYSCLVLAGRASHRSLVVSFLCFIFLRKVTELWMFAVVGRVAYDKSRDTIQVNTWESDETSLRYVCLEAWYEMICHAIATWGKRLSGHVMRMYDNATYILILFTLAYLY